MGVNKDIGKAYSDRLKNLEATPDEKVWEKIQDTLETKKKAKPFPFWFRLIGAGLGILLLSGLVYKMSVKDSSNPSSIEKNKETPSDKTIVPIKNDDKLISDSNENQPNKTNTTDNQEEEFSNSNSNTISDTDAGTNSNSGLINDTTNKNLTSTDKVVNNSKYSTNKNSSSSSSSSSSNQSEKNNLLSNTTNESENSIANSDNNKSNNDTDNNITDLEKEISINSNNKLTENKENNTLTDKQSISKNNEILNSDSQITSLENNKDLEKELLKGLDSTFKKDTLLIASKKDSVLKKKLPEKESKWEVGAYIIPTYFGSITKGSSLGEILEDKDKQASITLSYRILGNFKLSDKLTLRTGFGSTKLSYSTIDATQTDANGEIENLGAFTGISYDFVKLSEIYSDDLLGNSTSVDFKQEFTYFELPVELIYRIPKNKIEWKVFGGASVYKLSKNKIIAESSKGSYYIGVANNFSKYSYSVNLGGGFDYKISDDVNLTVEPIFKYYIGTFNRDVFNFKPISAGISFGATYKF